MDANQITDRSSSLLLRVGGSILLAGLLGGCTAATKLGDLASAPLEYVGLIKSSADDAQATAQAAKDAKDAQQRAAIKNVKITLFAGQNLNADSSGQGLALVTRIYTLRDAAALSQAPYETFTNPEREASDLGADIVKSRELVLTPGRKIETPIEIAADVNAIAVVALFRNPAQGRWRLVFDLKQAAKEGIVVGAQACALTVTSGFTGTDANGRSLQLLPPQCPP